MLGKCANPSCSASFRYLEEGLLFRLETDPNLRLSDPRAPEYYWLCRGCSARMTLRISEKGQVIPFALPAPVHAGPLAIDFIATERQKGLLLSGVSFSTDRQHRRRRKSVD